jgi:hypothetical protein
MAEAGISNGQISATVAEHNLLNGGFVAALGAGIASFLNRIQSFYNKYNRSCKSHLQDTVIDNIYSFFEMVLCLLEALKDK